MMDENARPRNDYSVLASPCESFLLELLSPNRRRECSVIQTAACHPTLTPVQKPSHPYTLPSEPRRRIGDGGIVWIGVVGVSLPGTSVTPTTGELRTEDDERERLAYGLADRFGDSTCGDNGEGATSTSSGGVYVPSRTALGGGRSTIASRSSFRRSSPAYSPSISSGPRRTVPFRKTSPSSSTQLRDLLACSDQY